MLKIVSLEILFTQKMPGQFYQVTSDAVGRLLLRRKLLPSAIVRN